MSAFHWRMRADDLPADVERRHRARRRGCRGSRTRRCRAAGPPPAPPRRGAGERAAALVWWPASPFVTARNFTWWPRAAQRAAVPPAWMSQSSGWAPKAMIRSFALAGPCSAPAAAATARAAMKKCRYTEPSIDMPHRRPPLRPTVVRTGSQVIPAARHRFKPAPGRSSARSFRGPPDGGIELSLEPGVHAAATGDHSRGPARGIRLALAGPADRRAREKRAQVAGLVRDLDDLRPP